MPNWCSNQVCVGHADPEKLQEFANAWNTGELLNTLIPRPRDLDITAGTADPTDQELAVLYDANREKYGFTNWYEWNLAHWGTKWDVGKHSSDADVVIDDGKVDISFDSAWAPPLAAYARLEEEGYEISAYYYEPGCGFCGHYSDGEDDSYEIPSTSAEAREVIPEHLDEMFGIIESMELWEEEEANHDR